MHDPRRSILDPFLFTYSSCRSSSIGPSHITTITRSHTSHPTSIYLSRVYISNLHYIHHITLVEATPAISTRISQPERIDEFNLSWTEATSIHKFYCPERVPSNIVAFKLQLATTTTTTTATPLPSPLFHIQSFRTYCS